MSRLLEAGRGRGGREAAAGLSALHLACQNGLDEVVRQLAAAPGGCDVNARDADGLTPLHCAAGRGSPGIVACLLAAGADPNASTAAEGLLPLHSAAAGGHLEVRRRPSPSFPAKPGQCPVLIMCARGQPCPCSLMWHHAQHPASCQQLPPKALCHHHHHRPQHHPMPGNHLQCAMHEPRSLHVSYYWIVARPCPSLPCCCCPPPRPWRGVTRLDCRVLRWPCLAAPAPAPPGLPCPAPALPPSPSGAGAAGGRGGPGVVQVGQRLHRTAPGGVKRPCSGV